MSIHKVSKAAHDDGFTLIELLVVMIIIGILAAIAVPIYLSQQKKGYDASVKSDLRTYGRELETYNADSYAYPDTAGFTQAAGGVLTVAPGVTVRVATTVTFRYFLNTAKSAFCIIAVNSKGTRPFEYISSLGGLQPASTFPAATTLPTACSTTAY
jgi:type IV pilus assembly protein PilA